jgi:hypothetical protein
MFVYVFETLLFEFRVEEKFVILAFTLGEYRLAGDSLKDHSPDLCLIV